MLCRADENLPYLVFGLCGDFPWLGAAGSTKENWASIRIQGVSMSSKTDTEVIIGGKVFTLSGYESEEYLQKVASYINNKVNEYNKVDSFRRQPLDTQSVLLQLNIADDYFKAKKQIAILEEELHTKEKELYDLKQELIFSQIKSENIEKQNIENVKKVIQLETELKESKQKETRRKT